MNKKIRIISGGTFFHVRPHFALAAPAFGTIGERLEDKCKKLCPELDTQLTYTKMAEHTSRIVTNKDVEVLIDEWVADPLTKIIFMPVALCDFEGFIIDGPQGEDNLTPSGKDQPRLQSKNEYDLRLVAADKIIGKIRKTRKDIFLVGFKTTTGMTEQDQYLAGLNLLKANSCNLVLANDLHTQVNMIITPEEAAYHVTKDRNEAIHNLVEMAKARSHLTFTRSTVIAGESVDWNSELVPQNLREVVNYCIENKAYKPFRGATVGHFAVKINYNTFLTSKRKTNFNDLDKIGLVKIVTDGPDTIYAYGSKPSVGGQSQRMIFANNQEADCIVHFHSPLKEGYADKIPIASQREIECGSLQCATNTESNLHQFGNLKAVMLDKHGPNIVFSKSTSSKEVIDFITRNFDLDKKTGGYNIV